MTDDRGITTAHNEWFFPRGGLGRDGGRVGAQQDDAYVGVRDPLGAGHAFRGGGIQGFSVVFTDDEYLVH